jgi:hypothetical protein
MQNDDKLIFTLPPDRQLEALARLNSEQGWQMFNEFLDLQMHNAYTAMFTGQLNADQILHNRATYMALKVMKDWARGHANVLRIQLEQKG